jgi:hypothetical protein
MNPQDGLETRWERDAGGHLTDAAIEALADAQPVSASSAAHVETCETCGGRLADAALRTAMLHRDILVLAEAPDAKAALARPRPRQSPFPYIAAALIVGVLASAPSVGSLPRQVSTLTTAVKLQASGFKQVGRVVLDEVSGPVSSLLFAAVLVAAGVAVAVWGSKNKERRNDHGFA